MITHHSHACNTCHVMDMYLEVASMKKYVCYGILPSYACPRGLRTIFFCRKMEGEIILVLCSL